MPVRPPLLVLLGRRRRLADARPLSALAGYEDLVNNVRSLPTGLSNPAMTADACLDACAQKGALVCGLSYCASHFLFTPSFCADDECTQMASAG